MYERKTNLFCVKNVVHGKQMVYKQNDMEENLM
jgi:hypothetical protein